jgi:hypothetical protein
MRVSSDRHSVIAVMSAARPLFHQKRKSTRDLAMSHKCQKLPRADAANEMTIVRLFDHLVGASEQRRWDCEAERPCGPEVEGELEPRRLL